MGHKCDLGTLKPKSSKRKYRITIKENTDNWT